MLWTPGAVSAAAPGTTEHEGERHGHTNFGRILGRDTQDCDIKERKENAQEQPEIARYSKPQSHERPVRYWDAEGEVMLYRVHRTQTFRQLHPLTIEATSLSDALEQAKRQTHVPVEYRITHAWGAMVRVALRGAVETVRDWA